MFCVHCGKEIADDAVVCVGCGRQVKELEKKDDKPWTTGEMGSACRTFNHHPFDRYHHGYCRLEQGRQKTKPGSSPSYYRCRYDPDLYEHYMK